MPHLTIAYMTNRKEPHIQWFFDSLHRELSGNYENIKIVVVDYYKDPVLTPTLLRRDIDWQERHVVHVNPKPNVWQGKHRLTKENYFAASNARNTAICLAPDGWIAFVDDLSVLLPGWYDSIKRAMDNNYIVLGAYKKVKDLVVGENGEVKSFTPFPPGVDSRWDTGNDNAVVQVDGGRMYGCSLAAPVEAFLQINGFDEDCDSMASEDYIAGLMLEQNGWKLMYDRRMLTYESEELHYVEKPFKRIIKAWTPESKFREKDASHTILNMVKGGRKTAPNYFGEGGIRAVRQRVLAGEPFPITQVPDRDWRDGQLLSEM